MKDLNRTQFEYHCLRHEFIYRYYYCVKSAWFSDTPLQASMSAHTLVVHSSLLAVPSVSLTSSGPVLHLAHSDMFILFSPFLMPSITMTYADNSQIPISQTDSSYFSSKLHLDLYLTRMFYRHLKLKTELIIHLALSHLLS